MAETLDHNDIDSYEHLMMAGNDMHMGGETNPHAHEIDNIPAPQEDHWGTMIPAGPQPYSTTEATGSGGNAQGTRAGDKAISTLLKATMSSRNTGDTHGRKGNERTQRSGHYNPPPKKVKR